MTPENNIAEDVLRPTTGPGGRGVGGLAVSGMTAFTMVDFPGKLACVVWFQGCNLKCQYCYNAGLIPRSPGRVDLKEVLLFLLARYKQLDGVVFSGGECLEQPFDGLVELAQYAKRLGMAVKIDTNGTHPEEVKRLVLEGVVDYVSLDIKASGVSRYMEVAGAAPGDWKKTLETVGVLVDLDRAGAKWEPRTTLFPGMVDYGDIAGICGVLRGAGFAGAYHVQGWRDRSDMTKPAPKDDARLIHEWASAAKLPFAVGFRNFAPSLDTIPASA